MLITLKYSIRIEYKFIECHSITEGFSPCAIRLCSDNHSHVSLTSGTVPSVISSEDAHMYRMYVCSTHVTDTHVNTARHPCTSGGPH